MKEKVIVGVPTGGSVNFRMADSLLKLQDLEIRNPSERYELIGINFASGLYIQENRNRLVKDAIAMGADWILQIDSDHSFEDGTLLRALMRTANKETRPIVAGLYTNIGVITGQNFTILDCIYAEAPDGKYKIIRPPSNMQPFRVDAVGSGLLLTHVSVYKKLDYPWFALAMFENPDGSRQMMNEDMAFCRSARMAGFDIWCDPIAEATHWKTVPLLPSTLREFLGSAMGTKKEMASA